jgi:two-component system phosphate regulon sensor histidine kinase PhoR
VVETLQDGAIQEPEVARDFLGRIGVEVDHLTELVRELGELSRLEKGVEELKLAPLDLGLLVESVVDRLRPQADRRGVQLSVHSLPGLPAIVGDQERLCQVLANLIHNAIKFTPGGGRVEVGVEEQPDSVLLRVTDTGTGISAEDLPHVFERFYKADKSRSTEGAGLGLAIAKHIVQAHGRRIWAESVEGRGSTFSFTLPLPTPSKK